MDGTSQTRLSTLTAFAAELNPQEEMAMRRFASRNDQVRAGVARVDAARMDYLAMLYREAGLKSQQARNAAKIEYAGFVGAQSLWPQNFGREVRSLGKIVSDLLLADLR